MKDMHPTLAPIALPAIGALLLTPFPASGSRWIFAAYL
jgi:hypothetical protein